jgi:predicted DNA-binding transcriptional regulator AlpA
MRENNTDSDLRLLSERETARRLCVSAACLRRWRHMRGGPPWCRVGERLVRYDLAELRRWVSERAGGRNVK